MFILRVTARLDIGYPLYFHPISLLFPCARAFVTSAGMFGCRKFFKIISIQNDVKQGNTLRQLLFKFALEFTLNKAQDFRKLRNGIKLNRT